MNCTACNTELRTPLETYGDSDAPMCWSCHSSLLNEPQEQPYFYYDDLGDGWQLKRLTETGAIVLGGKAGDALMKVNRSKGEIVVLAAQPGAGEDG